MIHHLRVLTWNANGLTDRRQELETFLHTEMIDVALISETRFTRMTHISIKNYRIYTTNHPSGNSHGGTAVIIKNNLKHYSIEDYSTEKIQATSVKLLGKKFDTVFSAVYCPPKHTIKAEDFKNYFSTLSSRFVCGGDWNSKHIKWGSRLINTRGRQLHKATEDMKLECLSCTEPTH